MDRIAIIIIVLTGITSFIGLNNAAFFERGKFNVGAILKEKQWDRLITSAFLHGDLIHFFFNMLTLYFFSDVIIQCLGVPNYLIIYFGAIIGGGLLNLWLYRKNPYYSAIGASGGVSGILFAAIALNPFASLMIFPIPIPIQGWIFGILYLAYSVYGMKTQLGNIGHAAHLGGALIGLILVILFVPGILLVNGLYIGIMVVPLAFLAYYVYKGK